jgi:hypothetical protein
MLAYFDLRQGKHMKYPEFLQMVLPCDNAYLRAATAQSSSRAIQKEQKLLPHVEKALSLLVFKEMRF